MKEDVEVIADRYESGGDYNANFSDPCSVCKYNVTRHTEFPCIKCSHMMDY